MGLEMEGSKVRRALLYLFLALLIAFTVLMSEWGMNWMIGIAEDNKEKEWARELHLTVGDLYSLTLRDKQAKRIYRKHYEDSVFSQTDEVEALYKAAKTAEDMKDFQNAARWYQDLLDNFPDHEHHADADKAKDRMKISKKWPRDVH